MSSLPTAEPIELAPASVPAEESNPRRKLSAEGRQKIADAQKNRWAKKRRRDKTVRSSRKAPDAAHSSLAEREIDVQLARAITERSQVLHKLSALSYWHGRLKQLDEEIKGLLSYQQALHGQPSTFTLTGTTAAPGLFFTPGPTVNGSSTVEPALVTPYSHMGPIPPGAGSIPAKQPQPSGSNVAGDIAGEGGFE